MDMINEIGRWLQEKEVLPTALERLGMEDKLAEIVLISLGITVLLGILSCFFGLKLARFWSFLTVFVIGTGAAAAVAMQITSDETLSGIIGLAAGIILAIVFAILKRAGMFVTAFVLGAAHTSTLLLFSFFVVIIAQFSKTDNYFFSCGSSGLTIGI